MSKWWENIDWNGAMIFVADICPEIRRKLEEFTADHPEWQYIICAEDFAPRIEITFACRKKAGLYPTHINPKERAMIDKLVKTIVRACCGEGPKLRCFTQKVSADESTLFHLLKPDYRRDFKL